MLPKQIHNMKVGIITLPFNNNYGGYLQCYALMVVLKNLGHQVTLINRMHNRRPFWMRFRHFVKAIICASLQKEHGTYIMSQVEELRNKGRNMMPFVDKNIFPKTRPIYNDLELHLFTTRRFDAVIVGSDQVWRPDYGPKIENYFLDFVSKKTKKISYAASFGQDNPHYTLCQIKKCSRLIEKFDKISVREDSGLEILNAWSVKLKNKAQVVLDPTMLLPKEHYIGLLNTSCEKKDSIFCYILDESDQAGVIVASVFDYFKMPINNIIDTDKWKNDDYAMPSIEKWLEGFTEAKLVLTDSFHGTVFSLIFNKPFVVYANKERGASRFISLLEHFGLESRIVTTPNEAISVCEEEIDWRLVNNILETKKKLSFEFLHNALT